MGKPNIVDAVLAILGPVLRLLAAVLESRFPDTARRLRDIGIATDASSHMLKSVRCIT